MRAFLSYSHKDNKIVDAVARDLGRQFCVYDKYQFDCGDEFKNAIRNSLKLTSVFVLFLSQNSKDSVWVNFEQEEAEYLKINGLMKTGIVFLLDNHTEINVLPDWLRRGLVKQQHVPKLIAKEIRHAIANVFRDRQRQVFVGRAKEASQAEQILLPITPIAAPRCFHIFGLPGIGRRTFCSRIAADIWNFRDLVEIKIEEGDDFSDIAAKFAGEAAIYNNQSELKAIVETIKHEDETFTKVRILEYLGSIVNTRSLPVMIDQGGMLDENGFLVEAMKSLINLVLSDLDLYICLVSSRKIRSAPDHAWTTLPSIRIEALERDETKRLLARIANEKQITLSQTQISELAEYVRGYPPAAFYAMHLVSSYGIDLILENKTTLIEFRLSQLLRLLSSDKQLTENRKYLLTMLAAYSPLPLAVISKSIGKNANEIAIDIEYLVDCAFVRVDANGLYWLADPLLEAVNRVYAIIDLDHDNVAKYVSQYLQQTDDNAARLDISRNLFKADILSGAEEGREEAITLANDYIELLKRFYHKRDYEKAIKVGKIAVSQRPSNLVARSYLARAFIHEECFSEAQEQIEVIFSKGDLKEGFFVRGFLERHRQNYLPAIEAYENALKHGRRGNAVRRELGLCYFSIGEFEKARGNIDIAQKLDPDNRYVVDLQILIATKERDEGRARDKLKVLALVDEDSFYFHRLSTVEFAFGHRYEAYTAAKKALDKARRPTIAMLSQLIKCQIEIEQIAEAEKNVLLMEKKFPDTYNDIKAGIRCKLEIEKGEWQNALRTWQRIRGKEKPVHIYLKCLALEGLIGTLDEAGIEYEEKHNELQSIKQKLRGLDLMLVASQLGQESLGR